MRTLLVLLAALATPVVAQTPDSTRTSPTPAPWAPPPAPAPVPVSPPRPLTGFVEAAVGAGGDAIAELLYDDGETRDMHSGQGGMVAVGARLRPLATLPVSAIASLGYKVVFEPSENANVRLSRIPVTLGLRGEGGPSLWAEASVVRHLGTTLHGDGFFPDESYKSSTGAVLAAGWKGVGAHYTTIRYTSERDGAGYDAWMVGVTGRVTFAGGW